MEIDKKGIIFTGMGMRTGTLEELIKLIKRQIENKRGLIGTFTGPMFSGKTKLLIWIIETIKDSYGELKILVVKPRRDTRSGKNMLLSYDRDSTKAKNVDQNRPEMILELVTEDTLFIFIDESHLFNEQIIGVLQRLSKNKIIIITGLARDYKCNPFLPVPSIVAMSHITAKLVATCVKCRGVATETRRKEADLPLITIGWDELYDATCVSCHNVPQ